MKTCTKNTIKDLAIGGGVGLIIGATCGSASGYAGLRQLCSIAGLDGSRSCEYLVTNASEKAIQVGCAVGAAVGCATMSFAYTAYKAAHRACNREDRAINLGGAEPSSSWS